MTTFAEAIEAQKHVKDFITQRRAYVRKSHQRTRGRTVTAQEKELVRSLLQQGLTRTQAGKRTGVSQTTVRRVWDGMHE